MVRVLKLDQCIQTLLKKGILRHSPIMKLLIYYLTGDNKMTSRLKDKAAFVTAAGQGRKSYCNSIS